MPGPTPHYPPELKREAIRLVHSSDERYPVAKVARDLDVSAETLRKWVNQAQSTRTNTYSDSPHVVAKSNRRVVAKAPDPIIWDFYAVTAYVLLRIPFFHALG